MHGWLQDLKHSARMFRQAPGFAIAAIAALALGIATNAAIFPVVSTVLLQPLPYPDPGRIVMFQNTFRGGGWTGSASLTAFNWWRQHSDDFQYVAAYDFGVANLTGESLPQQISIMHVSADFLTLCGLHPQRGRIFTAAADLPKAPNALVLAYSFWQRRFGGDPQVVGRRITIGGER